MSFEDNDNLYVLNEEETDNEKNPLNYAAYNLEEEDKEEGEDEENETKEIKKRSAFSLLFSIMFQPVEGWKSLRRSGTTAESMQSGLFYPILALLALGNFVDYFYSVNVSLSVVVTKAVIAFVSFFFAYFCLPVILTWLLPKNMAEKFDSNYGKCYFLTGLSTLAMFSFITELLPMIWPILIFLPIWTLYLMFKGVRFFHFQENREMRFFILSGMGVIGLPLLIDWVLNTIMPY